MHRTPIKAFAVVGLSALLGSCTTAGPSADAVVTTTAPAATSISDPTTPTTSTPVATPNTAVATAVRTNVCVSEQKTSTYNDIRKVTLSTEGDSLEVVWEVNARPPADHTFSTYDVWLTSADGRVRASASVQYLDGQQAHYTYVSSGEFSTELEETAATTDTSVTGVFPLDGLRVGLDFTWRATTGYGNTGEYCPAASGARTAPPELRFTP